MTLITDAQGNPYPLLLDDGTIPDDGEIPVAVASGNRSILLNVLRSPAPNLTAVQKTEFRQRIGVASNSTDLADMPSQLVGGARHLPFVNTAENAYVLSTIQASDIPNNSVDADKMIDQSLLVNHLKSTNSPFERGIPVGNSGVDFTHVYVEDLIAGTKQVGFVPTLTSLGRLTYQSATERQFTPVTVGTYTNANPTANRMYGTGITLPNVVTEWYLWSLPASESPDWHLINGSTFGGLSPRSAGSGVSSTRSVGLVTGSNVRTVYFGRTSSNEVLVGASHTDVAFNPLSFMRWVDPTVADNFVRPGHGIVYVSPGQVSGTNTIILIPTPSFTAYARGVALSFTAENDSTRPVSVNVNGLGVRELHDVNGRMNAGDIVTGTIYLIQDDGTHFQLLARSDGTETASIIKTKLETLSGNNRLSASAIRDLPSVTGGETATSIRTKLEALTGDNRISATAIRDLPVPPTAETGPTIKSKLEVLTGTNRLLASAIQGLPTVETGTTVKTKLEGLSGTNRLNASAIQNLPADESAASIKAKLETLMSTARLNATAIQNLPSAETPVEIRTKLETLSGANRLDAAAIKNIPIIPAAETGTTLKTKLEVLTGNSRLLASAIQGLPVLDNASEIRTKLQTLTGSNRLSASAIQGLPAAETSSTIRDKLQALTLTNRLDASAIKNLPGVISDAAPLPLFVAAVKSGGTVPTGGVQANSQIGTNNRVVWKSEAALSTTNISDYFTLSSDGLSVTCIKNGHVQVSGTLDGTETSNVRTHTLVSVHLIRGTDETYIRASDAAYQRNLGDINPYGQLFSARLRVEINDVMRIRVERVSGQAAGAPTLTAGRLTIAWQAAIPGPRGPAGASSTSTPGAIRDSLQTLTGASRLKATAIQGLPTSETGTSIKTKLEGLTGNKRLDVSAIKGLPTAETGTSIKTKLEALTSTNRLDASAIQNLPSPTSAETGATIKTKLETLTGTSRLIASAIQGLPSAETASTIRDKLKTLATTDRLPATAIQGLPTVETGATVKAKLETLSGSNRLLASAIQGLPTVETGATVKAKLETLSGSNRLLATAIQGLPTVETATTIKNKLETLTSTSRLDASAIQNLPAPSSTETGATIRTKLETLTGNSRLSASSIRDLPVAETGATVKTKLEALTGNARLASSAIKGIPAFTNVMVRTNTTTGTMWRQLTRNQYDALSTAEKTNGTMYLVETP